MHIMKYCLLLLAIACSSGDLSVDNSVQISPGKNNNLSSADNADYKFKNVNENIFFIGYVNDNAAFKGMETNNVYLLEDAFSLFRKGVRGKEPMFINSKVIITKEVIDDNNFLTISKAKEEIKIPIDFATSHVVANENGSVVLYVEDGDDDISALMKVDLNTGIHEKVADIVYYVEIIDENAYYLRLAEEGYPTVDVLVSPLKDFSKWEVVMKQVNLNGISIFPDGKYIFANTWGEDKKVNMVYDVNQKKYADLNIIQPENFFSFYSFNKKSVGFYHPKTHELVYLDFPQSFIYKRQIDK